MPEQKFPPQTFYHTSITTINGHTEITVDMTPDDLERRILWPRANNSPVIVNGRTIRTADIERITVVKSDTPSHSILAQVRADDSEKKGKGE